MDPDFLLYEQQYESIRANVNVGIISIAILLLEHCDALKMELLLVWDAEWSFIKLLYMANRFVPLVALPFTIVYNVLDRPTPDLCKIIFSIPCLGIATSIFVSEAILYVRVYALSGQGLYMTSFIYINAIAVLVAFVSSLGYYISQGIWGPSEFEGIPGCFGRYTPNGQLVLYGYVSLLYSGLVTMVLCVYFGLKRYWESRRSPLLKIFYRDGTFYFVVLTVMSIANGVAAVFLPVRYRFLMAPPQAVMHSTLSARMILHLRRQARSEMGLTTAKQLVSTHASFAVPELPASDRGYDISSAESVIR